MRLFLRPVALDVLEEKRRLIDVLNHTLESDSVNVFIGSESGYDVYSEFYPSTKIYLPKIKIRISIKGDEIEDHGKIKE